MKFLFWEWETKAERIAALERSCEQLEESVRFQADQLKQSGENMKEQCNEVVRLVAENEALAAECKQQREELAEDAITLRLQQLDAKQWETAQPSKTDRDVMEALKGVSADNGILKAVRGLMAAEREACIEMANDPRVGEREERHVSGGAYYITNVLDRLKRLHLQAQGDRSVVPVRKGRQRVSGRG